MDDMMVSRATLKAGRVLCLSFFVVNESDVNEKYSSDSCWCLFFFYQRDSAIRMLDIDATMAIVIGGYLNNCLKKFRKWSSSFSWMLLDWELLPIVVSEMTNKYKWTALPNTFIICYALLFDVHQIWSPPKYWIKHIVRQRIKIKSPYCSIEHMFIKCWITRGQAAVTHSLNLDCDLGEARPKTASTKPSMPTSQHESIKANKYIRHNNGRLLLAWNAS